MPSGPHPVRARRQTTTGGNRRNRTHAGFRQVHAVFTQFPGQFCSQLFGQFVSLESESMTTDLEQKIIAGKARAAVVGLGYVGLPLAVEFAASGLHVTGIDVSRPKVDAINAGRSYILDVPTERVAALVEKGFLDATEDFAAVSG